MAWISAIVRVSTLSNAYTKSMNITVEYVAGFVDGEGNIGVCGKGPRITLSQNRPEVLKIIRAWLLVRGIKCNWSVVKPKLPRRPNAHYMMFVSRKDTCEKLCRILLPFLIVKKSDCEGLLKWLKDHPYAYNNEPVDTGRFIELFEQGYTQGAIAKMMRHCPHIIARTAKKHGLKFPMGGRSIDGKRIRPMTERELKENARKKSMSGKCPDCGNPIYSASKRCRPCKDKRRVGVPRPVKLKCVWSMKYPCCVDCGTTDRPHISRGRCGPCRDKQRKRQCV